MLIDDVTIKVTAGKGGSGAIAFDKTKMGQGPTGGNGGNGGNIYLKGVANLSALKQFRYQKEIKAGNGKNGMGKLKDGATGKDIILKIPIGTLIHNLSTGQKKEITRINNEILIAKGGQGGKGNHYFRSSIKTSPKHAQQGLLGENFNIRLELKLIADIGLIGLPNVGKSTLLNELTNASSKVSNYAFTTLEPHLGVYYDLILADIPGLIKGASVGKGLGIKFLRHIERTKILFHLISSESNYPKKDYEIIRNELKKHNPRILEKQEYIFLSKSDTISEKELKEKLKLFKNAFSLSIIDDESMENIKKILNNVIKQKTRSNEPH